VAPTAAHVAGARPELLAIAVGAGSIVLSHVNDGGFWLVKEYLNLSVGETFASWTVCETILSVTGLALVLALSVL
jgi:GntP family gluconate:H+ symporter